MFCTSLTIRCTLKVKGAIELKESRQLWLALGSGGSSGSGWSRKLVWEEFREATEQFWQSMIQFRRGKQLTTHTVQWGCSAANLNWGISRVVERIVQWCQSRWHAFHRGRCVWGLLVHHSGWSSWQLNISMVSMVAGPLRWMRFTPVLYPSVGYGAVIVWKLRAELLKVHMLLINAKNRGQ